MAMASKAPDAHYQRKFTITQHAIERFRERVSEDWKARSDYDLGNLLDEKVKQCKQQYTVRDPRAPDAITILHEIELKQSVYYAIVRESAVITVLDEHMARNNFEITWKPTLNSPFADKLRGLQLALKPDDPPPAKLSKDISIIAPPRRFSPHEEAIMRGDVPPPIPQPPAPSPLEAAGIAYARALRAKHEAQAALARAQAQVFDAEVALKAATDAVTATQTQLDTLATNENAP